MAYGHRRPTEADGNHRSCIGNDCSTLVYWRDGEYCPSHKELAERRCLDCGRSSRAGTLDYVHDTVVAPEWTAVADTFIRNEVERTWTPKPIKPRNVRWYYSALPGGRCCYCDSANLAKLEFGLDRLPDGQRECTAWPKEFSAGFSAKRSYGKWLEGAADDPGITPKDAWCNRCGLKLRVGDELWDGYGRREAVHDNCPKGKAYVERLAAGDARETLYGEQQRVAAA